MKETDDINNDQKEDNKEDNKGKSEIDVNLDEFTKKILAFAFLGLPVFYLSVFIRGFTKSLGNAIWISPGDATLNFFMNYLVPTIMQYLTRSNGSIHKILEPALLLILAMTIPLLFFLGGIKILKMSTSNQWSFFAKSLVGMFFFSGASIFIDFLAPSYSSIYLDSELATQNVYCTKEICGVYIIEKGESMYLYVKDADQIAGSKRIVAIKQFESRLVGKSK